MSDKLPIICYHPGARGDFLRSVLFGNRLLNDAHNATVGDPGQRIRVEKLHWYDNTACVRTESDFKKFMSIKISADTLQEQKKIAWLLTIKHSKLHATEVSHNQWLTNVDFVKHWTTTFRDVKFDVVVPFENLFCVNYLLQLCINCSLSPVTNQEKLRIQKNIDLNLAILNANGLW